MLNVPISLATNLIVQVWSGFITVHWSPDNSTGGIDGEVEAIDNPWSIFRSKLHTFMVILSPFVTWIIGQWLVGTLWYSLLFIPDRFSIMRKEFIPKGVWQTKNGVDSEIGFQLVMIATENEAISIGIVVMASNFFRRLINVTWFTVGPPTVESQLVGYPFLWFHIEYWKVPVHCWIGSLINNLDRTH